MVFSSQPPYNIIAVNQVTASRALGASYINTSGRTMFVSLTIEARAPEAGDQTVVTLKVNTDTVGSLGIDAGTSVIEIRCMGVMIVPPGGSYETSVSTVGTGNSVISRWVEAY